jgi:hypothetical protein
METNANRRANVDSQRRDLPLPVMARIHLDGGRPLVAVPLFCSSSDGNATVSLRGSQASWVLADPSERRRYRATAERGASTISRDASRTPASQRLPSNRGAFVLHA